MARRGVELALRRAANSGWKRSPVAAVYGEPWGRAVGAAWRRVERALLRGSELGVRSQRTVTAYGGPSCSRELGARS